jgi:hypothetical protein
MDNPDPMAVFERAIDYVCSGQYDEALADFIWLQKPLQADLHFQALRRSYALAGWIELAKKFEPARVAIEELLEARRREHAAAPADPELFADLRALQERVSRLREA